MKSSLKKLRGFALHKIDSKEKRAQKPHAKLDELVQASQDMQDMRNCYDSLLSAAAAAANSAYEFSEALQEMGTCLLEKTSLNDDEQSGRVLLMLGKVQFELQKLVDTYRAHIIQTITTPSESLLKELQIVEEMKRQCDDKRAAYKFMLAAHKDKGRAKNAKDKTVSLQQLQTAQEDYEEEATLFVFRLKSLKQGQSRSLLTQAARHHAAQLHFFRKGLKSLEVVEPHVEVVAEEQHIDYHFSGLDDNDTEYGDDDDDYSYSGSDDDELSFDYGLNDHGQDVSMSRNSTEVDQKVVSTSNIELAQVDMDTSQADLLAFSRAPMPGSQSAPIFADKKTDTSEKVKDKQPSSTRKFFTYALPTPGDTLGSDFISSRNSVSKTHADNKGRQATQLWHSSPLQPRKFADDFKEYDLPRADRTVKTQFILNESNMNSGPIKLPLPLAEEFSIPQYTPQIASANKKIKRQAFSGPITSRGWSSKPMFSASESVFSVESPPTISARQAHSPTHQPSSSPKRAPSTSPPPVSSPKISELHELPRPPVSFARSSRTTLVGHSAPLFSRVPEHQTTSKISLVASPTATPLPTPPMAMSRSFSIPSSGQRTTTLSAPMLPEAPRTPNRIEEVASPLVTPMSLSDTQPTSAVSESATQSTKAGGL